MKIKGLTVIALICSLIVVWINFIDFKFEEVIEGSGQKIEYLIEGLCLSIISGWVFYFLNVYLVEREERKSILPFVGNKVMLIIVNNHSIINALRNKNQIGTDYYFPDKSEFEKLLSEINPKSKTPLYQNDNWIFLFRNRRESTLNGIDKIFLAGKHIDDELRRILLEMQSSLYLKEDYAFNSEEYNEPDLKKYAYVFSSYFDLIKQLKGYYDDNLKSYYLMALPKSIRKKVK